MYAKMFILHIAVKRKMYEHFLKPFFNAFKNAFIKVDQIDYSVLYILYI